jgi:hypothetical protein
MHGEGLRQCQHQLFDLLVYIPRDELNGSLHFGHDALRFLNALEARLAEPFLLRNGADRVDVVLDILGNELPVATHTALQGNEVVGVANGTDALGDRLAVWPKYSNSLSYGWLRPFNRLHFGLSSSPLSWILTGNMDDKRCGREVMDWKHLLAYSTGSVDQELLWRNEYLVTENRLLRAQIKGRIRLSDGERKTLVEIGKKLGRQT